MPYEGGTLWVPAAGSNRLSATYYVEALSPEQEGAFKETWSEGWTQKSAYFVEHHKDNIFPRET